MNTLLTFLQKNKYELLLFALIQHLFIGIFLPDLDFYARVIWPVNMLISGIASAGIFIEKGRQKNVIRGILFIVVVAFPVLLPFFAHNAYYMAALNITYLMFYIFIFWEIMRYLVRPGYINTDIISASACGYFLLIEIGVFLMQFLYYNNPACFKGIDASQTASVYIDFVYFCSITFTSIGFGDITPNAHYTKLITSFMGIAGQFYSVVLVGILISKFTSREKEKE